MSRESPRLRMQFKTRVGAGTFAPYDEFNLDDASSVDRIRAIRRHSWCGLKFAVQGFVADHKVGDVLTSEGYGEFTDSLYITSVGVCEAFQNKGYGKQTFKYAIQCIERLFPSVKEIYIHAVSDFGPSAFACYVHGAKEMGYNAYLPDVSNNRPINRNQGPKAAKGTLLAYNEHLTFIKPLKRIQYKD